MVSKDSPSVMQLVSQRHTSEGGAIKTNMLDVLCLTFPPWSLGTTSVIWRRIAATHDNCRHFFAKSLTEQLAIDRFWMVFQGVVEQGRYRFLLRSAILKHDGTHGEQVGNVGYGSPFFNLAVMNARRITESIHELIT